MLFDMNKPKPVPPVSGFVANFVNNLGSISGSIPAPESFTLTRTSSLLSFFCTRTVIVPLSLVNLIALLRRLDITWLSLFLSASTKMSSSMENNSNLILSLYSF
jgi:hypothetical protein